MVRNIIQTAAVVLACSLLVPGGAAGENRRIVTEDVVLGGDAVIAENDVLIARAGVTVTVERTLTVYGKLSLEGTGDAPVGLVLHNKSGYGLTVKGGTLVGTNVVIHGSGNGMEIYGSRVEIAGGTITVSGVQIHARGKSKLNLSGLRFVGGKAGIIYQAGAVGTVRGCVFSGQKKAGIYVYGTDTVTISTSVFSGCGSGIILSLFGASARVENNRFEGNDEGIRLEKFAFSRVAGNYFTANGYGMFFTKRSRGLVTGNIFEGNDVSVYLRYSSYPKFRRNAFKGYRRYAVMLENQSSEWEATAGGFAAEEEFAPPAGIARTQSGQRVPARRELRLPEEVLTGKLDFRENFWGDLTHEITEKGPRGNITGIFDGRDMPEFEDRGEKYPLDTVDFGGHLVLFPEEGER